jgi:integrase
MPNSTSNTNTPRNFADLIAQIPGWQDMKPATRAVMASGVRTVALTALTAAGHRRGELGALHRKQIDLRTVPCDIPWLNDHVFAVTAQMLGIEGKSTLGNAVSKTRGALRRVGLLDLGLPPVPNEPGPWRNLLDALINRGSLYAHGLAAFAAWCHHSEILPSSVLDGTLTSYESYLKARTLQSDIPGAIRNIAKAWRMAQAMIAEWPGGDIKAPVRRTRYTFPIEAFPESFQVDVTKLVARLSQNGNRGPFRGDGPRKLLRPASVTARVFSIRQAAAALILSGRPIETITSLADLVEKKAFESILLFYWQRAINARVKRGDYQNAEDVPNEAGVTEMTGGIAKTLMMIARHHCNLPVEATKVLAAMADDLTPPRRTQIADKNLARVRQFDTPKTRLDLLKLPSKLLKEAETGGQPLYQRAVMARTGLAIDILLNAPIRLKNLVSLQFGAHLRHDGSRQARISHLVIPASEMKNNRAYEIAISPELAAKIARYQRTFHPVLALGGSTFVFPAGRGLSGHIHDSTMRSHISSVVEERVGARINPHLFRHLVTRFTMEDGSGSTEDALQLLGDKNIGVLLSHYASPEPAAAARRHHERLRRACRPGLLPTNLPKKRKQ